MIKICTFNKKIIWQIIKISILIFKCRRKLEWPEKIYKDGYGIGKPNSHTTTCLLHWWKESVRALNQPTLTLMYIVCHPDKSRIGPIQNPLCCARNWTGGLLHSKQELYPRAKLLLTSYIKVSPCACINQHWSIRIDTNLSVSYKIPASPAYAFSSMVISVFSATILSTHSLWNFFSSYTEMCISMNHSIPCRILAQENRPGPFQNVTRSRGMSRTSAIIQFWFINIGLNLLPI